MTMAVVVLPRPLEQLNTKAARESSARVLFMASSSRSKSCQDEASGFLGMQGSLTLGSPLSYRLNSLFPHCQIHPCPPEGTQEHAAPPGDPPLPWQALGTQVTFLPSIRAGMEAAAPSLPGYLLLGSTEVGDGDAAVGESLAGILLLAEYLLRGQAALEHLHLLL